MNTANPIPLREPEGLASRRAALELLREVLHKNQPLEQASSRAFQALSPQDRAFALRLVKTVLRRLGDLNALLEEFVTTPLPPNATDVSDILRLGLAELLFVGTAPHAAVNNAVEMAKRSRFKGFAGLTNAVLKRAAREAHGLLARRDTLAAMPAWLRAKLVAAYGEKTARAIHAAHMSEPPLDLSIKSAPGPWVSKLGGELLPTGTLRFPQAQSLGAMEGFIEGEWWVQDAAAALPARLLGDVSGKHVLDLCAAPGGKTAQLLSRGARVTALDRSGKRLDVLRENLSRLKFEAEIIAADALAWQPPHPFTHILLDAPCSATGTLRRNPDVALHRTEADIAKLAALQKQLLDRAFEWLTPGGTMVYAVCSLLPEEGERQIELLLKRHENAKVLPLNAEESGLPAEFITPSGALRTLPSQWADQGGLDGFFAARIGKGA